MMMQFHVVQRTVALAIVVLAIVVQAQQCGSAFSCTTCAQNSSCVWCLSSARCVEFSFVESQCSSFVPSNALACPSDTANSSVCNLFTNAAACTQYRPCFWSSTANSCNMPVDSCSDLTQQQCSELTGGCFLIDSQSSCVGAASLQKCTEISDPVTCSLYQASLGCAWCDTTQSCASSCKPEDAIPAVPPPEVDPDTSETGCYLSQTAGAFWVEDTCTTWAYSACHYSQDDCEITPGCVWCVAVGQCWPLHLQPATCAQTKATCNALGYLWQNDTCNNRTAAASFCTALSQTQCTASQQCVWVTQTAADALSVSPGCQQLMDYYCGSLPTNLCAGVPGCFEYNGTCGSCESPDIPFFSGESLCLSSSPNCIWIDQFCFTASLSSLVTYTTTMAKTAADYCYAAGLSQRCLLPGNDGLCTMSGGRCLPLPQFNASGSPTANCVAVGGTWCPASSSCVLAGNLDCSCFSGNRSLCIAAFGGYCEWIDGACNPGPPAAFRASQNASSCISAIGVLSPQTVSSSQYIREIQFWCPATNSCTTQFSRLSCTPDPDLPGPSCAESSLTVAIEDVVSGICGCEQSFESCTARTDCFWTAFDGCMARLQCTEPCPEVCSLSYFSDTCVPFTPNNCELCLQSGGYWCTSKQACLDYSNTSCLQQFTVSSIAACQFASEPTTSCAACIMPSVSHLGAAPVIVGRMWCAETQSCVPIDAECSSPFVGSCLGGACTFPSCSVMHQSLNALAAGPYCGWCFDINAPLPGNSSGPYARTCQKWVYLTSKCNAALQVALVTAVTLAAALVIILFHVVLICMCWRRSRAKPQQQLAVPLMDLSLADGPILVSVNADDSESDGDKTDGSRVTALIARVRRELSPNVIYLSFLGKKLLNIGTFVAGIVDLARDTSDEWPVVAGCVCAVTMLASTFLAIWLILVVRGKLKSFPLLSRCFWPMLIVELLAEAGTLVLLIVTGSPYMVIEPNGNQANYLSYRSSGSVNYAQVFKFALAGATSLSSHLFLVHQLRIARQVTQSAHGAQGLALDVKSAAAATNPLSYTSRNVALTLKRALNYAVIVLTILVYNQENSRTAGSQVIGLGYITALSAPVLVQMLFVLVLGIGKPHVIITYMLFVMLVLSCSSSVGIAASFVFIVRSHFSASASGVLLALGADLFSMPLLVVMWNRIRHLSPRITSDTRSDTAARLLPAGHQGVSLACCFVAVGLNIFALLLFKCVHSRSSRYAIVAGVMISCCAYLGILAGMMLTGPSPVVAVPVAIGICCLALWLVFTRRCLDVWAFIAVGEDDDVE